MENEDKYILLDQEYTDSIFSPKTCPESDLFLKILITVAEDINNKVGINEIKKYLTSDLYKKHCDNAGVDSVKFKKFFERRIREVSRKKQDEH